jgi:hypothetical protein
MLCYDLRACMLRVDDGTPVNLPPYMPKFVR